VADDDSTVREVVREALLLAGFAVEEARDGAEAVALFERVAPDLVILDVRMPRMDGFEACVELRRRPGGNVVPILILTALDDVESITRAYEAGATDFASKPFNLTVLGHRVRYMLRARLALEELRRSQARLAAAQRIARLGHWERDLSTGEVVWSEEIFRLLGVEPGSCRPGMEAFLARLHPDDRERAARAAEDAITGSRPYALDLRVGLPGGEIRHLHDQAEVILDPQGRARHMAGTLQDITDRKRAEEQIRRLAYYDGLTRLPNRLLSTERLKVALENARRQSRTVAVLFLDLDQFKRINDTLGHGAGDRLLQGVADRLRKCLRAGDTIARGDPHDPSDTVARLGGDEFIISLTDIARGEDAARVARRILKTLEEPFRLDGQDVLVGGSIGISLYPHDGEDVEALLRNADSAMYHVKDSGRGTFEFYDRSMNAKARERLAMEGSLRKALERGELLLHFQPQVDTDTGAIVGAEALVRWNHPDRGLVPPLEFIPLAEETGLILPIGEWVLKSACAQGKAWRDAGHGGLMMAVNLSGRQFRQQPLSRVVREAVDGTGFDPKSLELELTESVLMRDADETVRTLRELRSQGPRISVDDFGTGYSSLSYLSRFPIDTLKIDRSFVRGITSGRGEAAIAAAIIAMARGLGLGVVAEGVESREQRDSLRGHGCRMMQGYLFGKPVPAEEFAGLLARSPAARTGAPGGRAVAPAKRSRRRR
jgi:diguanylate cyclase (GGDEF)-like protein/PAS domain S-box-containing protein